MEVDRSNVTSSAQPVLRMQRNHLRILEAELDKICEELKIHEQAACNVEAMKIKQQMMAMMRDYESYTNQVAQVKSEIQEQDYLIRQVEREISSLKTTCVVKEPSKFLLSKNMVSQLENRLDNINKRYNTSATENRKLRAEIDRMLFDRQSFNILWANHIKKMLEGKTKVLELVEQAISTYDQREEWCSKLEIMKEKAASDYKKHCQEIRELQRQLDRALKLEEFLMTKGTTRSTLGDSKIEAKKQLQAELLKKEFEENCRLLEELKEFTGQKDVNSILSEFQRKEEENYALFNYVNEINCELKNLHDNVKNINISLEDEKQKHEQRLEKQRESREYLEEVLDEKVKTSSAVELELSKSKKVLDNVMAEMQAFAELTDCGSLPILQLLGKNVRVSDTNIQIFLRAIEKKIMDVVDVISAHELAKKQAMDMMQKSPPSTRRRSTRGPPGTITKSPRNRVISSNPTPRKLITSTKTEN